MTPCVPPSSRPSQGCIHQEDRGTAKSWHRHDLHRPCRCRIGTYRMETDKTEDQTDSAYAGGFVTGLLTARYYALRHPTTGGFFQTPVPDETPDVVYSLLGTCAERQWTTICSRKVGRHLTGYFYVIHQKSWKPCWRLFLTPVFSELLLRDARPRAVCGTLLIHRVSQINGTAHS